MHKKSNMLYILLWFLWCTSFPANETKCPL